MPYGRVAPYGRLACCAPAGLAQTVGARPPTDRASHCTKRWDHPMGKKQEGKYHQDNGCPNNSKIVL